MGGRAPGAPPPRSANVKAHTYVMLSLSLLTLLTPCLAHPVLMLYYWRQRARKGLCWHCWYVHAIQGAILIVFTVYVDTVKNILNTGWTLLKALMLTLLTLLIQGYMGLMLTLLIHACNTRSHPNSFHCICRHFWYIQSNYNVDSYTKTSNYSKVRFKALIYFGLEQTLN